jgi:PKHD-type hydroxylase
MDARPRKPYFAGGQPMSEPELDSQATCIVCENAFTTAELDRIIAAGDGLTLNKAVMAGDGWLETAETRARADKMRITRSAGLPATPENKWIYDRIFKIMQTANGQVFQFDLQGFAETFQYTIYDDSEGGHYDWHIDSGLKKTQRKLSLSLQLTDPSDYQGCDLQFHGAQQIETAPRDRGAALLFPSYTLHRVTPVTSGVRKALVAWASGPKFK